MSIASAFIELRNLVEESFFEHNKTILKQSLIISVQEKLIENILVIMASPESPHSSYYKISDLIKEYKDIK